MAQRQCASLWYYLGFWKNYAGKGKNKWRFPDFLKEKIWNSEYFIQDTFLTYWNRFIGCKLFGHGVIMFVNDMGSTEDHAFCFSCYQKVSYWRTDDPWRFGRTSATANQFIKFLKYVK